MILTSVLLFWPGLLILFCILHQKSSVTEVNEDRQTTPLLLQQWRHMLSALLFPTLMYQAFKWSSEG